MAKNKSAEDIIRIVGFDPNKGLLKEIEEKGILEGLRGIGFNSTGTNFGGSGGGGGTDGGVGSGSSTSGYSGPTPYSGPEVYNGPTPYTGPAQYDGPEDYTGPAPFLPTDAVNKGPVGGYTPVSTGDISGLNLSNPYSMISSVQTLTDVKDLLDLVAEQSKIKYPEFSNYNSLGYNEAGAVLKGITEFQDLNGNDFSLRFDAGANGFPPPEGWDDAETPPTGGGLDDTFQVGYYWLSVWAFATEQQTPAAAAQEIANGLGGSVQSLVPFGSEPYTSYTATILKPDTSTQGFGINRFACTGGDPSGEGDYCSTEQPTWPEDYALAPDPEFWPSDPGDPYLVGQNDKGQFVSSQYDPNAPVGATNPSSKKDFSFESGTRFGSVEVTKNGGQMVYESATESGPPSGNVLIYDRGGQLVAIADAASIDSYRP